MYLAEKPKEADNLRHGVMALGKLFKSHARPLQGV
jgi:hypothetical protein